MAALLLTGAGLAAAATVARPATSPLSHASASPEALADAALRAIGDRDDAALARLLITRDEYETRLWPVLPDRTQMPFAFAWSVTAPRSRKARANVLADYGGLPLERVRVELGEDVEVHDDFTLYRRARLVVRRTDTGAVGVLPLMDTLVEWHGAWKFMNYVDHVRDADGA